MQPFKHASLRGKSCARSTTKKIETIFTLFFRRPRCYVRSITFHGTSTATSSCLTSTDVRSATEPLPSEQPVFLENKLVIIPTQKDSNEESHRRVY